MPSTSSLTCLSDVFSEAREEERSAEATVSEIAARFLI